MGSRFQPTAHLEWQARDKSAVAGRRIGSRVFLIDIVSVSPFKGISHVLNVYIVSAPRAGNGRSKHDQCDQEVCW